MYSVKSYCPKCGATNRREYKSYSEYIFEVECEVEKERKDKRPVDDLEHIIADLKTKPNQDAVCELQLYDSIVCCSCQEEYDIKQSKNWKDIAQQFNFPN